MKTFISRTFVPDDWTDSPYFVLQVEKDSHKAFEERLSMFELLPADDRPSMMVWFTESWGEYVTQMELERYLEDLGLDSEEMVEKIDNCEHGYIVLDGDQELFNVHSYVSGDDSDEHPRIDCEQVTVWKDGDIVFQGNFKHSSLTVETRIININAFRKAMGVEAQS